MSTSAGSSPGSTETSVTLMRGSKLASPSSTSWRISARVALGVGPHQIAAQPAAERRPHDALARLGVEDDADRLRDLVRPVGVLEAAGGAGPHRERSSRVRGIAAMLMRCGDLAPRMCDLRFELDPSADRAAAPLRRVDDRHFHVRRRDRREVRLERGGDLRARSSRPPGSKFASMLSRPRSALRCRLVDGGHVERRSPP